MPKVAISQIEVKYNPRSAFTLPKEFVESIKRDGLLQPLTLGKNGGDKYVLLDGERRFRACKQLGMTEVECYIREDLSAQQQKEVPIITDLMKDLLPIGDKAVAIANLVNKELKFTEEGIANMLGIKPKIVKQLIKIARLHPKSIQALNSGGINIDEAEKLSQVGKEDIQIKMANEMAKGKDFFDALSGVAYEIPLDDTFGYEQAKADNKIGVAVKTDYGEEAVYTFDKKYYEQKKKEYEQREKDNYEKAKERGDKKQKEGEAKKPKRDFKKARTEQENILATYKDALDTFLVRKPDTKSIATMIQRFALALSTDSVKMMLKAYKVEFVAKDMSSDGLKKLLAEKVLLPKVVSEKELPNLIALVDITRNAYGVMGLFDMSPIKKQIATMSGKK